MLRYRLAISRLRAGGTMWRSPRSALVAPQDDAEPSERRAKVGSLARSDGHAEAPKGERRPNSDRKRISQGVIWDENEIDRDSRWANAPIIFREMGRDGSSCSASRPDVSPRASLSAQNAERTVASRNSSDGLRYDFFISYTLPDDQTLDLRPATNWLQRPTNRVAYSRGIKAANRSGCHPSGPGVSRLCVW